jgi:hypothetical protein
VYLLHVYEPLVLHGQITSMVGGQWGYMTPGVIKDESSVCYSYRIAYVKLLNIKGYRVTAAILLFFIGGIQLSSSCGNTDTGRVFCQYVSDVLYT